MIRNKPTRIRVILILQGSISSKNKNNNKIKFITNKNNNPTRNRAIWRIKVILILRRFIPNKNNNNNKILFIPNNNNNNNKRTRTLFPNQIITSNKSK